MYKKVMYAAIIFSVLFCSCITSFAHTGRTDANGGHYNHSTGEYHYHHGYPAHQHTDGVCPYDFDDKTGENSGGSTTAEPSGTKAVKKQGDNGPIQLAIPAATLLVAIGVTRWKRK